MAKIYFTDGRIEDVKPKNGTDFSLEEMKDIVGGYIEVVYLNNGELMIVNEEGKLHCLQLNVKATDYMLENSRYDDFIVGNALVCDSKMVK